MENYTLVCPAGDLETLKVAINNGANAVYFGVEEFNARSKVCFSKEDFLLAVEYAHLYNVKVFITLNILISDFEFEKVIKLAQMVYENGADAIIVQDLGLYNYLKSTMDIELHLSTQAGIHNLYGAKVAEEMLGVKHIVLSRETILDDIESISKNTKLNLEYFVQGALCVAFSGNCYYSSMIARGSGNRGKCYQFCRKKYKIYENGNLVKDGYLLSPGDICMLDDLDKLKNAGIKFFKIEGRNRRSGYVGGVTNIYSSTLKNIVSKEYKEVMKQLFYRGKYNNLYLNGRNDIINLEYNNHIGIPIGEILKINGGKFSEVYISSSVNLNETDTLKVFDGYKEICSVSMNDLQKIAYDQYVFTTTCSKLRKGYKLNLIVNSQLEKMINEKKRKLDIDFEFISHENQKAILKARCGSIEAVVESEEIFEESKNIPLTYESVFKQLSKLNDTCFRLKTLICDLGNVFIPMASINHLRRIITEEISKKILENSKKDVKIRKFEQNLLNDTNEIVIVEGDGELPNERFDYYILSLNEFNQKLTKKINNLIKNNIKPFITLPIIARGEDLQIIDAFLEKFPKEKIGLVINNIYGLWYLNKGYDIICGEYMNCFNNYTLSYLKSLGVKEVILSPELNKEQYLNIPSGVVKMYGDMVYMNYCHCPKRTVYGNCTHCKNEFTIVDEKDSEFKLRTFKMKYCYNQLISNNTTNIIGYINPPKKFIKLDENNLECVLTNTKFEGTKNKKFTFGILEKNV